MLTDHLYTLSKPVSPVGVSLVKHAKIVKIRDRDNFDCEF